MEYIFVSDATISHGIIRPYPHSIVSAEEVAEKLATESGMRFDNCIYQILTSLDIQF